MNVKSLPLDLIPSNIGALNFKVVHFTHKFISNFYVNGGHGIFIATTHLNVYTSVHFGHKHHMYINCIHLQTHSVSKCMCRG